MSKELLDGWVLCPNVHHESGSPTYTKKDKDGLTVFATLDQLNEQNKKPNLHPIFEQILKPFMPAPSNPPLDPAI